MNSVVDIAYIELGCSDLERSEAFYTDFGLTRVPSGSETLIMRGATGQPCCLIARHSPRPGLVAVGLTAPSMAVLQEASRFPEASAVEALGTPGGGWRVRLASPGGTAFDLVFGVQADAPLQARAPLKWNHGQQKNRFGEWQRPERTTVQILRLGHVALVTTDFKRDSAWLESRLGMRASDVLHDGGADNPVGAFFHCTGAPGWVDHHTIALFRASETRLHHCSFELQDLDALYIGNQRMHDKGWSGLWGVGRHLLGSQIFDYWFDPDRIVVEHFTDGDLVRPGIEPGLHQLSEESLAQWGPPAPAAFLEPWKQPA